MPFNVLLLLGSCVAMVLLVTCVGAVLLSTRISEMKARRIHPQSVATARAMAQQLERTGPADNFRNLFEVPVLFYALVAMALALHFTPTWLCAGAWLFVALRCVHSFIHCGYNKVMHRFYAYLAGFALLVALWVAFAVSVAGQAPA